MSSRSLGKSVKRFFKRPPEAAYDAIRFDSGYKTLNEEQNSQEKEEALEKTPQDDEVSFTTALQDDYEVDAVKGGKGLEDGERRKKRPSADAVPREPSEKSVASIRHVLERYATAPTKLDNAVEDFVHQYKRLWVECQNNPTPLNYNASQDLFETIKSANLESSDHGTKSAFESLLRCAMDIPTAVDFLIQICWGAMGHLPNDQGKEAFHHWLAGLPTSPQPKTPVLGSAYNMKKQPERSGPCGRKGVLGSSQPQSCQDA